MTDVCDESSENGVPVTRASREGDSVSTRMAPLLAALLTPTR